MRLGPLTLRGVRPNVNGTDLANPRCEVEADGPENLRLRFSAPAFPGALCLEAAPSGECLWLQTWVEGLPDDFVLDSFGVTFEAVENLGAYLRSGYHSWDGASYVDPQAPLLPQGAPHLDGYALTQLLPRLGEGSAVLGFERHDRFQTVFRFVDGEASPSLTILTLWDRKERSGLARCSSERLAAFHHPGGAEAGLRAWARLVAAASPTAPRLDGPAITGWCSWYNLYAYIDEASILEHLNAAREVSCRDSLPMCVFQVDDGFTPEMGDWLTVKPQFPRGMPPLLDDIRTAGFVPGLWIAPFVVGCRSELYRLHPDWVVQDARGGGPFVEMRRYGEERWHKRSEEYYILDATHPEAFDYLRRVFHTWRNEWGCEYFKTDFMFWGANYGPEQVRAHTPGLTRIESFRQVAEMIRAEIGDALWLGCGCPLWAAVGLLDGVRTGGDVGVRWDDGATAQAQLVDLAVRNFANQILWQADPDCILLRNRFHHLSDTELRTLAIYAGMMGGVTMTSDHLGELPAERLRLWKLVLNPERRSCDFPLLGRTVLNDVRQGPQALAGEPLLVQVRQGAGGEAAVHLLNTGSQPVRRSLPLADLGLESEARFVYDWTEGRAWPAPVTTLEVSLDRHAGQLLFLGPEPIVFPPDRLP